MAMLTRRLRGLDWRRGGEGEFFLGEGRGGDVEGGHRYCSGGLYIITTNTITRKCEDVGPRSGDSRRTEDKGTL